MPATYTIDAKQGLVFTKGSGTLSDEDLLENLGRLVADSEFQSEFKQIADLRDVTALHLSTDGLKELAKKAPFGGGSRRAIVVNSPLAQGMARIYQSLLEDDSVEVKVFKDYGQACGWLGISPAS